jgi:hypothetical protein
MEKRNVTIIQPTVPENGIAIGYVNVTAGGRWGSEPEQYICSQTLKGLVAALADAVPGATDSELSTD